MPRIAKSILFFSLVITCAILRSEDPVIESKLIGCITATAPFPPGKIQPLPNLVDHTLIVNKMNGGLENAVIILVNKDTSVKKNYENTNRFIEFNDDSIKDRIAIINKGDDLEIMNNSASGTPVIISFGGSLPHMKHVSFSLKANEKAKQSYRISSKVPYEILASLPEHKNRSAYVDRVGYLFVFDNVYYGVTDSNGLFTIGKIPYGKYELQVWHESYTYEKNIVLYRDNKVISKNLLEIDITNSEVDLGKLNFSLK